MGVEKKGLNGLVTIIQKWQNAIIEHMRRVKTGVVTTGRGTGEPRCGNEKQFESTVLRNISIINDWQDTR